MAKILLVEDDKSLREIYSVRLIAEGYEIVSAGDGEEALAMAIKERPDLIVSDVMMPKISGFDMLDILRSTTETKDVKVIMMTALSSEDQRARGEALGADRYLVKSQVGIEDVVRTVHDVLGDNVAVAPAPVFTLAPPVFTPAPPSAPAPLPVAPQLTSVPFEVPSRVPATQVQAVYDQSAATPVVEPEPVYAMPQPAPAPVEVPTSAPLPVAPIQPVAPAVAEQTPVYQPVPVAAAYPTAAPLTAPMPMPAPAPTSMPQPTAPFSTPAPATLGERVISPLSDLSGTTPGMPDLSTQIQQALSGASVPPTPPTV
jgi:CheY-like chemotaxis protein